MAQTLTIDLSEVLAFAKRIGAADDLLKTELQETAMVAGVMVYQQSVMTGYVPVDTSTLRSSIGPVSVSGGVNSVTAIVPVGAEYGIYQERGWTTRNGRKIPGRFFMARALNDRLPDIKTAFGDMGQRLLRKIGG